MSSLFLFKDQIVPKVVEILSLHLFATLGVHKGHFLVVQLFLGVLCFLVLKNLFYFP